MHNYIILIIKKTFSLFILLFVISSCAHNNKSILDTQLNSLIEDANHWKVVFLSNSRLDSSIIVNHKHPFLIEQSRDTSSLISEQNFNNPPLRFLAWRQFLIWPDNKTDTIDVIINNKVLNLSKAQLILFGLDKNDNVVFSDSININNQNNWTKSKISLATENVKKIIAGIYLLGYDFPESENRQPQKFWLDEIKFSIENETKEIEEKINPDFIIDIDTANRKSFEQIKIPKEKTIIGIGENIHGSRTINQIEIELTKYLIENHNCKLLLLELDMYNTIIWDQFIKGIIPKDYIEEIKKELSFTLLSVKEFSEFLLWLRNYNEDTEDKVTIRGMMKNRYDWENYLFDYLYSYYNDSTHSVLVPILEKTRLNTLPSALEYAITHSDELEQIIGKQNYADYVYTLQNAVSFNSSQFLSMNSLYLQFLYRDEVMAENVSKFISLCLKENQKAVIIAHHSHINKKVALSCFPHIYSLGYYLNKKYSTNYYTLSIIGGEGSISSYPMRKEDTLSLVSNLDVPKLYSLENSCMNTGKNTFFYSTKNIKNENLNMRSIGNKYSDRYEYTYVNCNIKEQLDGFIFVKKIQPIDLSISEEVDYQLEKMKKQGLKIRYLKEKTQSE